MTDIWIAGLAYCFVTAGVFLGLWLWYDRRDQKLFDNERRRVTFHCRRCGSLYAGSKERQLQPCGRCGQPNPPLRF